MPKLSRRRVARELVRLINEQPSRKAELLKMTAAYLVQTKQSAASHLLISDIADEMLRSKHVLSAEVQSAFKLGHATRENIIAMLKKQTGAHQVELSETVNPELIGGVIIRTPQLEMNASVKRQLTQLAGGM